MKIKKLYGFCIVLSLLVGCAGFSPQIRSTDKVDLTKGYIFGKFSLTETVGDMAIALSIENEKGKSYNSHSEGQ